MINQIIYKIFLSAIFLVLEFSFPSISLSSILDIPQQYQEKDQWCWAAVSQAILEYYGTAKSQTEIADYGTNGDNTWNWIFGGTPSPTRNGIDLILNHFGQITSSNHYSSILQPEVQAEIDEHRPFVIRWAWSTGGGHFLVGKGIVEDLLYLMDPWYGVTINDYNWVVSDSNDPNNATHTWSHTLTITTSPPPKCDPSHLNLCTTEQDCNGASGYWYSDTCNNDPPPQVTLPVPPESFNVY